MLWKGTQRLGKQDDLHFSWKLGSQSVCSWKLVVLVITKDNGLPVLTNEDFTGYGWTTVIPECPTCYNISKHCWWRLSVLSKCQCALQHSQDFLPRCQVMSTESGLGEYCNVQPPGRSSLSLAPCTTWAAHQVMKLENARFSLTV